MFLKQVIVVEGKTDVQKIKQAFPGDELEFLITNGLGFDETFLEVCKKTNAARGIIVMTDPDGPGNKIRARINEYLDFKCANAFVDKKKH
jgi:ribonuclease M5